MNAHSNASKSSDLNPVRLRRMNDAEYDLWRANTEVAYAKDKMKANGYSWEEAQEVSRKDFERLLPLGLATLDQHLFSVLSGDANVGVIWFCLRGMALGKKAFIYDIVIDAEQRGRGFGRKAMKLAEGEARELGAIAIGLHVFGFNTPAIKLYESLNYQVTDLVMEKPLA